MWRAVETHSLVDMQDTVVVEEIHTHPNTKKAEFKIKAKEALIDTLISTACKIKLVDQLGRKLYFARRLHIAEF